MMESPDDPSILIVGAGVFGASTAYHLSKIYSNPSLITVVDRTPFPPEPAASTDINKIIRADYSSAFYCELAYEALHAWEQWPDLRAFHNRSGWILLDEEGDDLAGRIRKIFNDRGHDPTKDIDLADLDHMWKGILKGTVTEGFEKAYWNPEAGWCDAAGATAKFMEVAVENGVKYVVGEVKNLAVSPPGVQTVQLRDGRALAADKIVLATGAWTSELLSPVEDALGIPEQDRVERQATAAGVAVAHYKMSAAEMDQLSEMPVVVYGGNGEVIPPSKSNQLLKYTNAHTFTNTITTASGHRISVPPSRSQQIVSEKLQREFEELMMNKVMPTFPRGKSAEHWRICWDARTPTQDWLLTQHPHAKLRNLYLAVGGSFHSYKFLPTIGKYMLNVLSGEGNGEEKDRAWAWKKEHDVSKAAHPKTAPKRELSELED
nr:l-pipecolate oxidase [Quercus suber]